MRENPPSLNVDSEVINIGSVHSSNKETNPAESNVEVAAPDIDWDISVESSQIDWDIGTVEETEDTGNGLGPYEIINASEAIQTSSSTEDVGCDPTISNEELGSHADICWDISVESAHVDVIDDVNASNAVLDNQSSLPDALSQLTENKEGRSQLLDTEYRNKILDDLYEVFNSFAYLLFCQVLGFAHIISYTLGQAERNINLASFVKVHLILLLIKSFPPSINI